MSGQVNFRLYAIGSTVLASLVVVNAYMQKVFFYPTCVYLATSKTSVMALGNMMFVLFIVIAQVLKNLFFGTLRDVEVEVRIAVVSEFALFRFEAYFTNTYGYQHLTEKIWSTMMDTLLIMTVFREEFNAKFISLFLFLLFMKTFHWLSQDRVDFIQQTPHVSRLTHARMITLLTILILLDVCFVQYAISFTMQIKGPSMMILFGFEYLLLTSSSIATMCKYFLNVIDMRMDGRWESKGAYVLYLEFVVDFFRLVVYIAFFGIILTYYGIPLHIIRQLWITFMSFRRKAADVIRYRRATANMDARFPNATPQELREAETCIVCREDMTEGKKLPCGHILHLHCLRSWLERQQVCPICRNPVLQEENQQANQVNQANIFPGNFQNAQPNFPNFQAPNFGNFQNFAQPNAQANMRRNPSQTRMNERVQMQQDQNYNPLEQIQIMQLQIQSLNEQLQRLYNYVAAQQANNANANINPNPSTNANSNNSGNQAATAETLDDMSEEEMLRRAIEESQRTAIPKSAVIPQSPPTPERSPPQSPSVSDKSGKEEEKLTDTPVDETDKDALRKRRLLKFSGQKQE